MIQAVTPSTPTSTQLALTLDIDRDSDSALLRVLAVLHRRRCRVTQAMFSSADGPFARLELRVEAPPFYAPRVAHWLGALVDVRRATDHGATAERALRGR